MPTPRDMREAADRASRDRSSYAQRDESPYGYGRPAGRERVTTRDDARGGYGQTSHDGARGDYSQTYRDETPRRTSYASAQRTSHTASETQRQASRATSRASRTAYDANAEAGQRASRQSASRRRAASKPSANRARSTRPSVAASETERPHRPQSQSMRETVTRWRMYGVRAFAVIMIVGGFIGLLFFARPTSSAVEMRNLTPFPELTAERFLNGAFFTDLSLWYADTYPLREPMVAADHSIDGLFGVNTGSGMVGGNVRADDIPVDETQQQTDFSPVAAPTDAPDEKAVAADIQANIMSGVYIADGAGYSIYYFSQNAADTYITAMNTAVERLDGVSTVYSIMAPANSITLPDDVASAVGGSDQQQALDYLSSRYDQRVKPVDLIDIIKEHRDEYLYFRTDHHWTQLGAYYGYVAFCEKKGVEPKKWSDWRSVNLGEFKGTYTETIESMGYTASDEIEAHVPSSTNDLTYWDAYGTETKNYVINEEAASWEPSLKYTAFAAGDRALEVIHNPKLDDGSSCLVVKDSYGCAFVPCLVDDYQTVHVIDFRETNKNICDYAIENNIQDVIFMTGTKIGLTDTVAQTLLSEVS